IFSPLVTLTLFLVVRYLVRGPGLTLNFVSGSNTNFFWSEGYFSGISYTCYLLYRAPLIEGLLIGTGLLMLILLGIRFNARLRGGKLEMFPSGMLEQRT